MNALIDYCTGTSSTLSQLSLDILVGRGITENYDNSLSIAARDCGIAWALTGIIRAIPFQASQASRGRCMLPMDLLREAGINWQDLSITHQPETLRDIVRVLADEAQERIKSTRQASKGLPKSAIPALLPVTLALYYQKQIMKTGYNAFDECLQHSHSPLKTLTLMYAGWRKKI